MKGSKKDIQSGDELSDHERKLFRKILNNYQCKFRIFDYGKKNSLFFLIKKKIQCLERSSISKG